MVGDGHPIDPSNNIVNRHEWNEQDLLLYFSCALLSRPLYFSQ
jgi:hypothetical protein